MKGFRTATKSTDLKKKEKKCEKQQIFDCFRKILPDFARSHWKLKNTSNSEKSPHTRRQAKKGSTKWPMTL